MAQPTLTGAQKAALSKIKFLCEYWRITDTELARIGVQAQKIRQKLLAREAKLSQAAQVAQATPIPQIKYRHPIFDYRWDGSGPQPAWIKEALIKEGYTVEELRAAAVSASLL